MILHYDDKSFRLFVSSNINFINILSKEMVFIGLSDLNFCTSSDLSLNESIFLYYDRNRFQF